MSWPTETLDGVDLFGGDGKAWLHAFCQAVNEREGAIDIPKTEWILADGSEASDPVLSDFDGIRVHGSNSPVRINFQRVQTAIKTMLGGIGFSGSFFTESSGYSTPWTVANMEADIGLGTFKTGAFQFHDLVYWSQLKEALDRMIYARRGKACTFADANGLLKNGSEASPNPAWDEMYADAESGVSISTGQLGWSVLPGGFSVSAVATRKIQNMKCVNAFSGSLTGIGYTVTHGRVNFSGPFDISIGSASHSFSSASSVELTTTSADLPLGGTGYIDFEITTALPASNPFSTLGGPPYVGSVSVVAGGVYFYFDIASLLTDKS